MTNMVEWHPIDSPYKIGQSYSGFADTGEGGLFAWAVVRHPEPSTEFDRSAETCHVDVSAYLNFPDVQVSGPRLWSDDGRETEDVLAAVFLGSTPHALYSQDRGEYFNVTEDDLNEQGKAIVAALGALGKVDILTFLDT
jgi:hypothetical protein